MSTLQNYANPIKKIWIIGGLKIFQHYQNIWAVKTPLLEPKSDLFAQLSI